MKSKNVVKIIKGERCYRPATYARKYGRALREVCDAMKDGRLPVVIYYKVRYTKGEPPAGWQVSPDWVEPDLDRKPEPVTVPDLPDSPLVPSETLEPPEQPAPKRARSPRSFDLNFEKARKTAADAELAELKLADKRGELADKYVNLFYDCFARAVQPYKMKLAELDLKGENIRILQTALEKLLEDLKANIGKALAGDTDEPEEEDE